MQFLHKKSFQNSPQATATPKAGTKDIAKPHGPKKRQDNMQCKRVTKKMDIVFQ